MYRVVLGLSLAMFLQPIAGLGQAVVHADTIPTSPFFEVNEYLIQVPLGQTFIGPGNCQGLTTARYHLPDGKNDPIFDIDTTTDQHLRTTISMSGQSKTSYIQSQNVMRGSSNSLVSYRMAGSMTIEDDPAKYVMELNMDPAVVSGMKLDLGYGSARLDLSGLKVRALQIVSGAADVVITYSKPNAIPMKVLQVNGGMSKIVLRNLEYSRAENISIENALGDTKIVLGENMQARSMMHIDVGAGNCTLLVHKDAPIKVVINGSVFSSAPMPEGFLKTGDNTFVSHSYKLQAQQAMTIVVDLGLGSFEMIPFE